MLRAWLDRLWRENKHTEDSPLPPKVASRTTGGRFIANSSSRLCAFAARRKLCDHRSLLTTCPYEDCQTFTLLVVAFCCGNAVADTCSARAPGGVDNAKP